MLRAQPLPAAQLSRRLNQSRIDALIDLLVRCRLRRQIRIWLDLRTVSHLRIATVIPQRWSARRGHARWLGLCTHVVDWQ
ncbi:MAG: hypothetical protein WCH44_04445 [Betaproteobacteria bacterium]